MTYQQALALFMQKKADILTANGIPGKLYFTEQDREDIYKYVSCKEARPAWKALVFNISNSTLNTGLSSSFCPWCILTDDCEGCKYELRHKNCEEDLSDFRKIIERLNSVQYIVFTRPVYKQIIKDIKKELNL